MKRINTQSHSPRLDRLNESKCRFQPLLVALWVIPATLVVAQPAIPGASRRHLTGHLTAEMRRAPVEYGMLKDRKIPNIRYGRRFIVSRSAYERWEATIGQ